MDKAKILVVEDEPNLLLGIRDILELDEYEVVTAKHGREALEILNEAGEHLPDLIVSDIMMPYMDGLELLKVVRQNQVWVTIPFIFLTARGEKRDVHDGKKLGVDDYLIKPFDADDLLVAVEAKLRRKQDYVEEQTNALEGIKRRILTILNHEFRTPLTLVVAYADMLQENRQSVDDMNEEELIVFLKEINTGADRLRRLIENFIMMVELETGDAATTFEWRKHEITNLEVVIQQAHDRVMGREQMQHTCNLEMKVPLPSVMGDREYLMIVIRELLDNAVKFSDPTDPIEIEVTPEDDELAIKIIDQGRGIPQDELNHIWETFYQVDREQHEDQGAGSGLALVKHLVDLHQGRVDVKSVYGEGSTFIITLPTI